MKNRRRIYNAPFFFSLSLAADCGPGPKLKFKITRARYRPMNQRERSGEFIAGLPCKYKNGYSQLFDARARAPSPNPLSLSAPSSSSSSPLAAALQKFTSV